MADKTIGSLPAISAVADDSLFVAEQQGAAGRVSGAQIRAFAEAAAETYVGRAETAAEAAEASQKAAAGSANQASSYVGSASSFANKAASSASTAQTQATRAGGYAAAAAKSEKKIENMEVAATTLGTGAAATVTKGTGTDGVVKLTFGLPRGAAGETGPQGNPGADGVSPTVTVTDISGGHRVTITDAGGAHSFDVLNGSGSGDMQASVYDPQGKAQDAFAYADSAAGAVQSNLNGHIGNTTVHITAAERTAWNGKLDKTGDGSNVTAAFTQASGRSNIATGEKLSVLFGKIKKWFADLGSLAFKSTVSKGDLASDVQASLGKADTALQSAPVTSVNGKTGAVTVAVPTIPATADLLKGNGSGGMSAATAGTDYATPAQVNAAKPKATLVTLTAAGWNTTSKTQTVTVSGVLADESKQLIQPCPAMAGQTAYREAGVRCTAQAANSLTFTADTVPTVNLSVYIAVTEVQG